MPQPRRGHAFLRNEIALSPALRDASDRASTELVRRLETSRGAARVCVWESLRTTANRDEAQQKGPATYSSGAHGKRCVTGRAPTVKTRGMRR